MTSEVTPIERTAEQERAQGRRRKRQRAHERAFEQTLAIKGIAFEEAANAIERGDHHSGETNNG